MRRLEYEYLPGVSSAFLTVLRTGVSGVRYEPVFVCKFVWERSVTCVILRIKMTSRDRILLLTKAFLFRECDMDEPVFVCKFVWERSVTCVILKMTSRDRLLYCRLALIACVPVWLNAEKSLRNRVPRRARCESCVFSERQDPRNPLVLNCPRSTTGRTVITKVYRFTHHNLALISNVLSNLEPKEVRR
eukprot:COSAG02_NODE_1077_length_14724_cov_11.027145_2_plen_189_part_00